ncbi:MAG: flippase-like domain-containing protein [Actinomycetota bacterium]|nr:flippase-like domain-containing protein [Actinomycetota bacterium]
MRPTRSRPGWGKLLRIGFLVLVAALAIVWVYVKRHQVGQAWGRVTLWPVVGALALAAIGAWTGAPAWRDLLAGLGSRLTLKDAQRVFLVGQLGKYIPGGVWTVFAQATMARELEVPKARSGTASLMSIVLSAVTSAAMGAILLLLTGRDVLGHYGFALLLALPMLALLHPGVLVWAGRVASKWTGRSVPLQRIPETALLAAAGWLVAGSVFNGLQVYLLAGSIGGHHPPLLLVIGLFAFAAAAGLMVPIAPAGAGIRELILVFGLSRFMDSGSALLVVLMARLVMTVADFGLAGATAALGRRRGPPSTSTTTTTTTT